MPQRLSDLKLSPQETAFCFEISKVMNFPMVIAARLAFTTTPFFRFSINHVNYNIYNQIYKCLFLLLAPLNSRDKFDDFALACFKLASSCSLSFKFYYVIINIFVIWPSGSIIFGNFLKKSTQYAYFFYL